MTPVLPVGAPLHHVVRADLVPDAGLEWRLEADVQTCAAVARFLDQPAVESLRVSLQALRWGSTGLAVTGVVEAQVVQSCVVTLQPVHNGVREEVRVFHAPAGADFEAWPLPADETRDDVEELPPGGVDLGLLALEHLALGLDPYPRSAGAVFDEGDAGARPGSDSPFAGLDQLISGRKRR